VVPVLVFGAAAGYPLVAGGGTSVSGSPGFAVAAVCVHPLAGW
jgi:hypothetical protein